MFEERNEAPFILELSRSFATVFTMSILAIVLAGLLVARYAPEAHDISTLFALKGMGLPYSTILQITGLSVILAFFNVLLLSGRFLAKMRFLTRFFLLFLAIFFTTSIFIIIFKWFPVDDLMAWISYVISFIISFSVCSGIVLLKFKLEDKKYNRLLTNFKAKRKDNQVSIS
jgi:hypothetical protein